MLLLLLSSLGACSDAVGPDQPDGALLAAGSLALEWSADGSEIFYYDTGYTTVAVGPPPSRILAVNVTTRATRVVVDSGAYGFAGAARPGIPPRVTIAGLAYLRTAGAQFALHVVTDTGDVPVGASGPWFTATPDRTRLLYSPAVWSAFDDSIGVIDLVTGARTAVATGPYHPPSGSAISPDGHRMLVERQDAQAGFGILDLSDGTITVLHDSLFPGPLSSFWPIPLGWNAAGVWFVEYGGPPHLIRYDPATGAAAWFPIGDVSGGTRVVTGGAALALGGSVVWSQSCNATDPLSGICEQGAYALWLVNPLTGVDQRLVSAHVMPDVAFPRAFFAAPSPNGRALAYVLGNELRLLVLR
jgi:dipeptidyl aminopeptidase/acylaminoacyl peptidase